MSETALTRLAIGALILGVVLMIPFDATITRVAGLLCLFGFIVVGVFAVARPERLEELEVEPERVVREPPVDPSEG